MPPTLTPVHRAKTPQYRSNCPANRDPPDPPALTERVSSLEYRPPSPFHPLHENPRGYFILWDELVIWFVSGRGRGWTLSSFLILFPLCFTADFKNSRGRNYRSSRYKIHFFLVRRKIWTRYAKESETRMDISEIEVFCVYRTRGTKANVRLHARRRGRKTWQEEGEQGQVRRKKGGKGKECRTQVGVGSVCKPRTAKATRLAFLHFFSASSPPPQPRAIRNVPYEIEITRW